MMYPTVKQKIFVTDRIDIKKYPALITKVNDQRKEIHIHFINWSSKNDEILPFDSERITSEEDLVSEDELVHVRDNVPSASPESLLAEKKKEVIGKLRSLSSPEPKGVISAFNEKFRPFSK